MWSYPRFFLLFFFSILRAPPTRLIEIPVPKLTTMSGLGVPVKLLHESLGHIITVELKTGQLYRGKLAEGTHVCPLNPHWQTRLINAFYISCDPS